MPDYSTGKIYKIHSYQTDLVYYGSTTQTLCRRFSGHKTKIKCGHFITSKQLLEYNDAMITLVELFPCGSRVELESRERFYIENNPCVNTVIPTRTDAEYRIDNKDKAKIRRQRYRESNKDKIKTAAKQYNDKNKDKITLYHQGYRDEHPNYHRSYRKNNKEYIARREYWRRTSPIGILARAYF